MKATDRSERNYDLDGSLESQGGAPYAVYNRIGTLGNGFLMLIDQTWPSRVENAT